MKNTIKSMMLNGITNLPSGSYTHTSVVTFMGDGTLIIFWFENCAVLSEMQRISDLIFLCG
jgi:1,2-phenylacetyl-CoA epoxidase catalytic subunit